MTKHLVQHGDDLALIITKPMLKKLGIDKDSALTLEVQDGVIVISAKKSIKKSPKKKEESVDEISDRLMKKYSNVFKKLAEDD